MERIEKGAMPLLVKPGVTSKQLVAPRNSKSRRVTLTEVRLQPDARQERHAHSSSEQVWYALQGEGQLLLAAGKTAPFSQGEAVRFEEGEVHGLWNSGPGEFVYLSVTAPPLDFTGDYEETR